MSAQTYLQFAPFSSALDAGFWHKLSQLKLDVFGLDDSARPLVGYYTNSDADLLQPRVNLDYAAFDQQPASVGDRNFRSHGQLKNTNTFEDFKSCDKKALLDGQGAQIWADIVSGRALDDPSLLVRFLLLTYAELKKYHYYYWFAFTAICIPKKVVVLRDAVGLSERFSDAQIKSLVESFDQLSKSRHAVGAFLISVGNGDELKAIALSELTRADVGGGGLLLAFCDPCTLKRHPGWPLRNLLALVAYHRKDMLGAGLEVVCFRDRTKDGCRSVAHSIVLHVRSEEEGVLVQANADSIPDCVGWEKNEKQKLGPRMIDLSLSMDPRRLAESAVDLNLKLMRWRLVPDLDLEKIKNTRCLLLGAGTLGCNVARCLLGWGVRNITLVDNGLVSYSNPVRQSLLTFDDSLSGGRSKSVAAAEGLRRIFPGVNAVGLELSVPMPGHAVTKSVEENVRQSVDRLRELFDQHDAVFLLMDTRESRWLPTVMGTATNKIVINAALGFDTYLVVRHGVRLQPQQPSSTTETLHGAHQSSAAAAAAGVQINPREWKKTIKGENLGCYFCNDVVAPGDSTHDRTLDQQCTVSRPGLSMIASALAAELLVSVLTHPLGPLAAAETGADDDFVSTRTASLLGAVPHQIRGFLSRFHNMMPASAAFDRCTACSPTVIDAYLRDGFEFLLKVFNQPRYLEDLTGLSQLLAETADSEMWNISDVEDLETDDMS